jgi:hypothetical protein
MNECPSLARQHSARSQHTKQDIGTFEWIAKATLATQNGKATGSMGGMDLKKLSYRNLRVNAMDHD